MIFHKQDTENSRRPILVILALGQTPYVKPIHLLSSTILKVRDALGDLVDFS